jgi:hypothetical protein
MKAFLPGGVETFERPSLVTPRRFHREIFLGISANPKKE